MDLRPHSYSATSPTWRWRLRTELAFNDRCGADTRGRQCHRWRRPHWADGPQALTEATPHVLEFMTAVRRASVDVSAVLGWDEQGGQITEFVPGRLTLESAPFTHTELDRAGAMVRAIHDASETFVPSHNAKWPGAIPAPGDELVCHNDLAPWNFSVGDRWVFIDWDATAPSTRVRSRLRCSGSHSLRHGVGPGASRTEYGSIHWRVQSGSGPA